MPPQTSPRSNRLNSLFSLLFSLLLIVAAMWAIFNRQLIVDNLSVWQNQPSSEVEQLAVRSGMSEDGRFTFYASVPQVSERQEFTKQCGTTSEQAAILGCYTAQRIYIFDVDDPRLDGIKEVTAAHEMLHAVYERLSTQQRDRIDRLTEEAYDKVKDQRLEDLIKYYDQAEPGHRHNELHAILGTEYASLPAELEDHYGRYFADRSQVVALAQGYQQAFANLGADQQAIIDELNNLSAEIESATDRYNQSITDLSRNIDSFNQRASSGQFASQSEFDSQRSQLIDRQTGLQAEQQRITALISRYEQRRQALDDINLVVADLNHSINANLPEAPGL